jgi:hypothetical protein
MSSSVAIHKYGQLKAPAIKAPIFGDASQDTQYLAVPSESPSRLLALGFIEVPIHHTHSYAGAKFYICAVPGCKERFSRPQELIRY